MKRFAIFVLLLSVFCVSCKNKLEEIKFKKEMQQVVAAVNATLPIAANEWVRKDSIAYNSKDRILYHYFTLTGNTFDRMLNTQMFKRMENNDFFCSELLRTENLKMYIDNNISMGVVYMLEDGEIILKKILSPKEMKLNKEISSQSITEYLYTNMSLSINALCPLPVDECTTVTHSFFNKDKMELMLYWELDKDCEITDEQIVRDAMRGYLTNLITTNHNALVELERYTTLSVYKKSTFPVKITLVFSLGNGDTLTESMYSTDVIAA